MSPSTAAARRDTRTEGALRLRLASAVLGLGLGFGSLALAPAAGWAQTLPQYAADVHVGVTSCSGAPCHGAAQPLTNARILQNEFLTWSDADKHHLAFAVLKSERSKRIAVNLGLPSAEQAPECLTCHADFVANDKRGRLYSAENGVGCEACHGGSQRWLGLHVTGTATRADLRSAGLYPTDDPVARAKLCLSCHFGDAGAEGVGTKFVTHRIMGAGHPRISFELNTFTAIQPAHFTAENEAAKGKHVASGVQTWAIGQVLQFDQMLKVLVAGGGRSPQTSGGPDLVFFDCYACHHAIPAPHEKDQAALAQLRWRPRPDLAGVVGPGEVPFNDANALMMKAMLEQIAPEDAKAFGDQLLDLHRAMNQDAKRVVDIATQLRQTNAKLLEAVAKHSFGKEDMRALMAKIVNQGVAGLQPDYSAAEQAYMALNSIVVTLQRMGALSDKENADFYAAYSRYQDTMKNVQAYDPTKTVESLNALSKVMAKI